MPSAAGGPAARAWLALLALLILGAAPPASAAQSGEDPILVVARDTLAGGQPGQALRLLAGHPGLAHRGPARLLLARVQLALGRGDEALAALDPPARGVPPPGPGAAAAAPEEWPPGVRGLAAQLRGEALLLRAAPRPGDEAAARLALESALRQVGEGVEVDRCFDLLAELARRAGDGAALERYAGALWREWPRSPYHAHAGVLLAHQVASAQPERARGILAELRVSSGLPPALRLDAAELLCRVLLPRRPGECLVVAEQEAARAGAAPGQLPLYRALALAALDPDDGRAALDALPPALAGDAAVAAARVRLEGGGHVLSAAQRRERAGAEAELGHAAAARSLLAPIAADDAEALALFVQLPGVDPETLRAAPAARQAGGALALGRALVLAGRAASAWAVLQPRLDEDAAAGLRAPLLYWAEQAARQAAPELGASLRARLLACPGEGEELGLAWSDEARRREAAGDDAASAWARAAEALPDTHPWQPAAAWRAARAWSEHDERLGAARDLLRGPAWAGEDADQLRCRFLLAQVLERLGDRSGARQAAESLLGHADAGQKARLEALLERVR